MYILLNYILYFIFYYAIWLISEGASFKGLIKHDEFWYKFGLIKA